MGRLQAVPDTPDHPGPDRRDYCLRCLAHKAAFSFKTVAKHRPCFKVGCQCECSQVPGYIA